MPSGLKLGKEAQAKFDEAKSNPDLAGTLDKKGAKRKNWNSRWFVLKDNYLFYCKNQKTNPQGIINLHGCTVSRIEGPTARPNSFSVLAPKSVSIDAKWTNRTYFMAAKDAKEMDRWMKTLEENGKKAVERAAAKKKDAEENKKTGTTADNNNKSSTKAAPAAAAASKKNEASSESESESESSEEEKKPTKKGGSDSESESDESSEEEEKPKAKPAAAPAAKKKEESESESEEKSESRSDSESESD